MGKYVKEVLIPEAELQQIVRELGQRIAADYEGKELVIIGVLKGAFIFMADLVRQIHLPVKVDFMAVSSYGEGTETTGLVKILKDCDVNIRGQHVIVVEDIIDSGLTLSKLAEMLTTREPASLELCAMFDKPSRRKTEVPIKYVGRSIPDEFVVGYGLDFAEYYRNLPEISILADDGQEENS